MTRIRASVRALIATMACLVFVAGGMVSAAIAASVGTNWELQTTPGTDVSWTSITYGGSAQDKKFVAVGSSGAIMYSSNGNEWLMATEGVPQNNFNSVTWGGAPGQEKFVAVSTTNEAGAPRAIYSADGITWHSDVTGVPANKLWASVAYGDGVFVALAYAGESGAPAFRAMKSEDGINWTVPSGSPSARSWRSLTYGAGMFVGVANNLAASSRATYSADGGETWQEGSIDLQGSWASVTYGGPSGNEKFVAVGAHSDINQNRVMTSIDGINWTVDTTVTTGAWTSIAWGGSGVNSRFVAVGNGVEPRVMTSPNGIASWMAPVAPANREWQGVAFGGNKFAAIARNGGSEQVMTSTVTFSVDYEANGASSGSIPPVSGTDFEQGDLVPVASNTGRLVRKGFVLAGWDTRPNGSGTRYLPGSTFTMPADSVVLYAAWVKVPPPVRAPSKPRKLKTTGKPNSSSYTVKWLKPMRSTSNTKYQTTFRVRGRSDVVINKKTSKRSVTVTRKRLLKNTYRTRGEYRGIITYRVSVIAVDGSKQSAPATILLRVRG